MTDTPARRWPQPPDADAPLEAHRAEVLADLNRIEETAQRHADNPGPLVDADGQIVRDAAGRPLPNEQARRAFSELAAVARRDREQLLGLDCGTSVN